ncbi:MAG: urea carboxylase, partial [Burkholderiales bacterium]|nr:urea carboxylase [Opitutaceae bacterium]
VYPVMLKSTAGGGGIGMKICQNEPELAEAFESVKRMAASAFKQSGVFLEKYVGVARHIEVQIFGDGRGRVVALGERDCSAQRRNQKVVEETPAPGLSPELRAELLASAQRLASAVGYQSAGTVEFVFDVTSLRFYFLEVNTRLQVEHGVTEEVTGIDLVEWMVKAAAGELDLADFQPVAHGASLQVRLYAEDPNKNFQPSSGVLTAADFPSAALARVETWVERGSEIPSFYDPMIAKIIVTAPTRAEALVKLATALAATRVAGIECNLDYLRQITASPEFAAGQIHTKWLATFPYRPATIDVVEPGTQTSVQDYPGRVGYWAVGVPPSGPMDDYAHRIANELVGNAPAAAALEITLAGPTLRFNTDTSLALCGAEFEADLDGNEIPWWRTVHVRGGAVLRIRGVKSAGCRAALAVRGGFDVPSYLGSKSTFALGKFGGHAGRVLRHGDVLPLSRAPEPFAPMRSAPAALIPTYSTHWEIRVLYGPHAAPDFFTEASIATLFASDYKVHYNSNRLGIRLIGPKPEFTRADGGEAGLHPSNIHDTEYAIGTLNFTGELPVILAKDGPSLGGFVCPVTIIKAELWKVGQLRPGDTLRFVRTTYEAALDLERAQDRAIAALEAPAWPVPLVTTAEPAIVRSLPATATTPAVVYRMAGDKYMLLEYGPLLLDLDLRFRVFALMEWFKSRPLPGLIELSPGVRSLQLNYDGRVLPLAKLLDALVAAEAELPPAASLTVPSRLVRLPLAFDADTTRAAIAKYRQSVRDTAPWLPSNVEFIRRINGLPSVEDVERTIYSARYLVLGLGDVYLGAPCAVPIDPRHRLQTTKYNPARTWTAEGEVGIGGVYMCVYGMESPGGYQLVGRTVPVWNTHRVTREFPAGQPWLLRFFDQVQFYPMPEAELNEFRREFHRGRATLDIVEQPFRVSDYHAFLERDSLDIAAFKARQTEAFNAERERWAADGSASHVVAEPVAPPPTHDLVAPAGGALVASPIAGSVWQVPVKVGDSVAASQKVAIIEAMKMEVPVEAPIAGVVTALAAAPGLLVTAGQPLLVISPE